MGREQIDVFMRAISGAESGGNYNAVNSDSGAAGKYQIMPANWPAWSKEAGLGPNAPRTPENQEKVARFKMLQYFDQFGSWEAVAVAWYAGPGAAQAWNQNPSQPRFTRAQGGGKYPSIADYVRKTAGQMAAAANAPRDQATRNAGAAAGDAARGTARGTPQQPVPAEQQQQAQAAFTGTPAGATLGPPGLGGLTALPPDASPEEVEAYIRRNYGYLSAFLDIPEIRTILSDAAKQGWDTARLQGAVYATEWWRNTSAAEREWQTIIGTDNAEASRRLTERLTAVENETAKLGLTLDPDVLWRIADASIRFNWSDEQMRRAIGAELRKASTPGQTVAPGQGAGGDAAALAAGRDAVRERVRDIFANRSVRIQRADETEDARLDRITDKIMRGEVTFDGVRVSVDRQKGGLPAGGAADVTDQLGQMAADYMVPMNRQDLEQWAIRIIEGTASEETFRSWMTGMAVGRFAGDPTVLAAIERGITPSQYFSSHRQMVANSLEIAPDQIDLLNDPRFSQILDVGDKDGNRRSMSLSEVAQWARKQPEWQRTRQANEQGADLARLLTESMGKASF